MGLVGLVNATVYKIDQFHCSQSQQIVLTFNTDTNADDHSLDIINIIP